MDRSRIGIVIPALNESNTIVKVIKTTIKYGIPIVVDDGSTDDTASLALQAGAVVVSHKRNLGYDAALNSGFKKAVDLENEIVVTLDADGQHDPSLIEKFISEIEYGAEIVIGIRSKRQRLAEHIFAYYTNHYFGIKDPLCGMKAYRLLVYKALDHFDSFESIGTELTIFAAKNGFRMSQININVLDRQGSSRFGKIFSANYRILRAMILSVLKV